MKIFLFAIFVGLVSSAAMSKDSETRTIQTPNGPVTATRKTLEPVPQKITIATQKEISAMDALAAKAKGFVATYVPGAINPSLKDFDKAFHRWLNEKNRRFTEQRVTEFLGAYLGNRLISDFQMEWVVVTDQYGTDYAVRSKKVEVMSFPFSSVSKRIESHQHEFMVGVYETVGNTIASGDYKAR